MLSRLEVVAVASLLICLGITVAGHGEPGLAFATVVGDDAQERAAGDLLASLRAFGGSVATTPFHVVVDGLDRRPCAELRGHGAILHPLVMPADARSLPLAEKAYAAALVEGLVAGTASTLVWLDSETLVLAPPTELALGDGAVAMVRPVFLANTIGQPPDQQPDAFWTRIYAAAGVTAGTIPTVRTEVDGVVVRAYYNCGVMAWQPSSGLAREWARALTELVGDRSFIATSCSDPLHRLFLHQAVFSAVLVTRTTPGERRALPPHVGYPLHLHQRLPAERRAAELDRLTVVILDDLAGRLDRLVELLPVAEPHRSWLAGRAGRR